MINFEEELKKYSPQLLLEDVEENLKKDELQDLSDLFYDLIKKITKGK